MGPIPSSLYQQIGWDLFPDPVTSSSESVPMGTNSRHCHPDKTHSGLFKCDTSSGPSISAEPARNNRVESPPQNSASNLRDVGNSNSGHVCHSPQHSSSPVYVSNPGASSTGRGGRCSCFHHSHCLAKLFRNSGSPRRAK